jgi:hypothetical protein
MNNFKPNLIDINNLIKLKNIGIEPVKIIAEPDIKIDNFLSFLNKQNANLLLVVSILIFFIILSLFLYFRYKNKETKDFAKHQTIIQFVSSVDNHLNYNKTSI